MAAAPQWIEIDGATGEGGGQVLRSALTLSVLTGKPVRLVNIRARRPRPGLMAQHLKAVEAAAAVAGARVEGARLGSTALQFAPRAVHAGSFRFDIGTAGSTTLVLQTVLVPLGLLDAESRLTITGGTHVPWSPCAEYVSLHWLPHLRRIGFNAEVTLEQAGFYPRGGGRLLAYVQPASALTALSLVERGKLRCIRGLSAVARLDPSVAERQRQQALRRLARHCDHVEIRLAALPAPSPGSVLLLLAEFEHSQACYTALGARGKPAERVADEAVDALEAFLESDAAIDQYLADQLLIPLACVAATSELRTASVTQHLITNADVVRHFVPVEIHVYGNLGQPGTVQIHGTNLRRTD
jgi:RNA 3'-phosphate cyclase